MEKNTSDKRAKARSAQRRHRCTNFDWRKHDPVWQAERRNDKVVFRKIYKLVKRYGWRPLTALKRLDDNPLWHDRLIGKSLVNWKRKYNLWRQHIGIKVGRCASRKICVSAL